MDTGLRARLRVAVPVALAAAMALSVTAVRAQPRCLAGMAFVTYGGFCVDRYEAALVEVLPSGEDRPWSPYQNPGSASVRAVSRPGQVPQGYISQAQAEYACIRSRKRLCSDDEWQMACRGPRDVTFGYGARREPGRCNENHTWHPVTRMLGGAFHGGPMNDPRINQLEGTLGLTGAFARCTNELGVFDMVGNLHEWTDDPGGTFRGGYYMDTRVNGDGCDYATRAHDRDYHDYSTGFRCCVTPTRR